MVGLFNDGVGFHNIGVCIILLTIVIYLLMYPLNSKQQKSSRLMGKINPEIQAIQKKYKGKKDQETQMKMNQETQEVYAKYGISPFGGCLPLLITMPILWCLYRVIYNIENYVPELKSAGANHFLGLDVKMSPLDFFKDPNHPYGWLAFLIPILAMVLQFINSKMMQVKNDTKNNENSMAQSMKMMNYFMPIMSGFFCLSLFMGIGIYWIIGSLFRICQAYFVNKSVDKISLDDLIEQNKEKAAKKKAKRDQMNSRMGDYSRTRTSSIKTTSAYQNKPTSNSSSDGKATNLNVNKDIKPGSISGYANMLSGSKKDKK